jgi:DHA1 family multidrug resistance protein-like MFS transporter
MKRNRPQFGSPMWQVALAATVMALSVMGDSMLYAVLPTRLTEFGLVAGAGVGLLLSVNRWVRLVTNSWAAWISRRFGIRWPFLASLALAMMTTAIYALYQGFWPLLAARIGWGLCFSVQQVTTYMVVLHGDPSHRGKGMGLFNAIFRSGSLIAVLIGGLLADSIGVRAAFLGFASLVVCGLPLVMMLDDGQQSSHLTLASKQGDRRIARRAKPSLTNQVWGILLGTSDMPQNYRYRSLAVNYLRFTNTLVVSGLIGATLGFLIWERLGASAEVMGVAVGATSLTGIVLGAGRASEVGLSVYFGHLSDKVGRERLLRTCIPIVTIITLLITIDSLLPLIVGVPIIFAATTAGKVTLDASAGDLAPLRYRTQVMGRYATWTDLGAALGPLAGFGMIPFFPLPWVYVGAVVFLVSGLVLYTFAFTDRRTTD